jgi:cellulase/cellobiase CelA1
LLDASVVLAEQYLARAGDGPDGYAPLGPIDVVTGEGEGEEGEGEEGEGEAATAITLRETDRWDSGACFSADVASSGDAWSGVLQIEGSLGNYWNSIAQVTGEEVLFSGAAWNEVLPAGAHADVFGFCTSF